MEKNTAIAAAAVILVILLFKYCSSNTASTINTITHDTVTVTKQDTVHSKPILLRSIRFLHDTITGGIDTVNSPVTDTPQDYDTQNIYTDTLRIDSTALISVLDTIQGNRITGRKFAYTMHYQVITNNTIVQKSDWYYGLTVGRFTGIGLVYKSKRNHFTQIQAGINRGKFQIQLSKYWHL